MPAFRKRSKVWRYFKDASKSAVVCTVSGCGRSLKPSPSTMRKHLLLVHNIDVDKFGRACPVGELSSSSRESAGPPSLLVRGTGECPARAGGPSSSGLLSCSGIVRGMLEVREEEQVVISGSAPGSQSQSSLGESIITRHAVDDKRDVRSAVCIAHSYQEKVALCFVMHSLPYRLVGEPDFRATFMKGLVVTPESLSETVRSIHVRLRNTMKLRLNGQLASLATDGWTKSRFADDHTLNIFILAHKQSFLLRSVRYSHSSSAANIMEILRAAVKEAETTAGVLVTSIVTDNASNEVSAVRQLIAGFCPWMIHIPCCAHSFELLVSDLVRRVPIVSRAKTVVERVLAEYSVAECRRALRSAQEARVNAGQQKGVLKVIRPANTRWSSLLKAMERLVRLQAAVDFTSPELVSVADWASVQASALILKPLCDAVMLVQADRSIFLDVWDAILHIHRRWDREIGPSVLQLGFDVRLDLSMCLNELQIRVKGNLDQSGCLSASVALDPRRAETYWNLPPVIKESVATFLSNFGEAIERHARELPVDSRPHIFMQERRPEEVRGQILRQFTDFTVCGSGSKFTKIIPEHPLLHDQVGAEVRAGMQTRVDRSAN